MRGQLEFTPSGLYKPNIRYKAKFHSDFTGSQPFISSFLKGIIINFEQAGSQEVFISINTAVIQKLSSEA